MLDACPWLVKRGCSVDVLAGRLAFRKCWQPLARSSQPGQVKCKQQSRKCTLVTAWHQQALSLQVGCVALTSLRLLWIDTSAAPQQGNSCQLPLSAVSEVVLKASMVMRSPKIRVLTFVDEHGKPASGDSLVRLVASNECKHAVSSCHVCLSFAPLCLSPLLMVTVYGTSLPCGHSVLCHRSRNCSMLCQAPC